MVLNFTVIKKIVKSQCGGNLLSLTNYLDLSVWSQLQMKTGGNLSLQSWSTQNIFSSIVYFLPDLFIYSEFYRKKNRSNKPISWILCHICLKFSLVLSESTVPISCQSPGDYAISPVLQHSLQSEYCRE